MLSLWRKTLWTLAHLLLNAKEGRNKTNWTSFGWPVPSSDPACHCPSHYHLTLCLLVRYSLGRLYRVRWDGWVIYLLSYIKLNILKTFNQNQCLSHPMISKSMSKTSSLLTPMSSFLSSYPSCFHSSFHSSFPSSFLCCVKLVIWNVILANKSDQTILILKFMPIPHKPLWN